MTGWAWDPSRPDEPVDVAVMDGTDAVLMFRADRYRPDLAEAGVGNGRHAFLLESIHSRVPWSRRNLSVVRARDGAMISSRRQSLIATGSPHLYLSAEGGMPCVALGDSLYQLAGDMPFSELAAWLPITLPEVSDDELPVKGQVRLVTDDEFPLLVFEPVHEEPMSIRIQEDALAGPHVRLCKGRARDGGWVRNELVLEVENAIGLELECMLPARGNLGPKLLSVLEADGEKQVFELPRDSRTTIAVRVSGRHRHRMTLSTELEPSGSSSFLLCGLDVISRDIDLPGD
ncbi:hypothetical protein [Rhodopila sp.]|uniref:hypothetical protein n=1 Tax=Rhodopila sp. TaxID=2480087 RepID=UPI002CD8105C|nr:hypothetical protein [Rhodopila sp.]HVZ10023.1 hypothetical protein [Rhodopila sp.]